jgi:hypothetical protein
MPIDGAAPKRAELVFRIRRRRAVGPFAHPKLPMSTPEEDKRPDLASGKHRVDATNVDATKVESAAPPPPRSGPPPDPTRKLLLGTLAAIVTALFGFYGYWLVSAKTVGDASAQTAKFLAELSGPKLTAYVVTLAPLGLLLTTVAALLVRNGLPKVWNSARRSALLGVLLGACLFAAWLLTSQRLDGLGKLPWWYFIPVVPPVLLGYQALLVWRQRPRSLGKLSLGISNQVTKALMNDGTFERFDAVYRQLLNVFGGARTGGGGTPSSQPDGKPDSYPSFFVTNFAVPGLLLLLVGFGVTAMAVNNSLLTLPAFPGSKEILPLAARGLRWGAGGAFVYVLIDFGARLFRNDLTVGAAVWSIVTLIVGPTLAVLLAVAWKLDGTQSPWQAGAVMFFAGLAPRRVVTIVEGVALQLLKAPNETTAASDYVPLTRLRGLNSEVAVRLREENVHDVGSLAYADPVRLVLSLPYDLRQVVDWIDQAQLAVALPAQFDALRAAGVTGAIDLAWRWMNTALPTGGDGFLNAKDTPPENFRSLVLNPDREASLVYETARQLFYEEQVCLLWVMYNCFSTTASTAELASEAVEKAKPQSEQARAA